MLDKNRILTTSNLEKIYHYTGKKEFQELIC